MVKQLVEHSRLSWMDFPWKQSQYHLNSVSRLHKTACNISYLAVKTFKTYECLMICEHFRCWEFGPVPNRWIFPAFATTFSGFQSPRSCSRSISSKQWAAETILFGVTKVPPHWYSGTFSLINWMCQGIFFGFAVQPKRIRGSKPLWSLMRFDVVRHWFR